MARNIHFALEIQKFDSSSRRKPVSFDIHGPKQVLVPIQVHPPPGNLSLILSQHKHKFSSRNPSQDKGFVVVSRFLFDTAVKYIGGRAGNPEVPNMR
jgi:hypothetical protein